MGADTTEDARSAAVEQLKQFGLSTYAARTFVALVELGSGTARDVSRVSDVPRTRVYDAADELREYGLAEVRQTSPKEFWAVSAETANRAFEREFERRTRVLRSALEELEPAAERAEDSGVETVVGAAAITDRLLKLFDGAEAEIVHVTVEDSLTEELVAGLASAIDRGVSVRLGGLSPAVEQLVRTELSGATTFEPRGLWSEARTGRLAVVDERSALVSTRTSGGEADQSDRQSETAICGAGRANGLVVLLGAISAREGAPDGA